MQRSATTNIQPIKSSEAQTHARAAAALSARMDRLPVTRYLWVLVFLISLGGFFEVYDLIFTGYIAPGMAKSGLLKTTTTAFFGLQGYCRDVRGAVRRNIWLRLVAGSLRTPPGFHFLPALVFGGFGHYGFSAHR
jgi:hypothetical protein